MPCGPVGETIQAYQPLPSVLCDSVGRTAWEGALWRVSVSCGQIFVDGASWEISLALLHNLTHTTFHCYTSDSVGMLVVLIVGPEWSGSSRACPESLALCFGQARNPHSTVREC